MYRDHFGFNELPFKVTPDPRFIYNSAVYDEVLGKLRYGIEAKKGFIVVSGEAGTGKTTLLRRLMRSFSDRVAYAYIFNPRLKFTSLLRMVLKDLGIPAGAADKELMLEQLNEYLLQQHKQGRVVAWIFDEAQGLSDDVLEELRLLGNLETDSEKLVQIILVGQPGLESRLDQAKLAQLKQRVAQRHVLYPLAPHDVGPYLAARLDQAGYKGGELFNADTVKLIAGYSRGIPRVINSLCDNALVRACQAGARTVTPEIIDEAAQELRLDGKFRLAAKPLLEKVDDLNESSHRGAWSMDHTYDRLLPSESDTPPARVASTTNKRLLRFAVGALMTIAVLWPSRTEVAGSHVTHSATAVRGVVRDSAAIRAPVQPTSNRPGQPEPPPQPSIVPAQAPLETIQKKKSQPAVPTREAIPAAVATGKVVQRPARRVFRVSGDSFLRNKPTANADIVDILHPGMRVEVTRLGGEFLRVRSLGAEGFSGFVHKEDAFFEPLR